MGRWERCFSSRLSKRQGTAAEPRVSDPASAIDVRFRDRARLSSAYFSGIERARHKTVSGPRPLCEVYQNKQFEKYRLGSCQKVLSLMAGVHLEMRSVSGNNGAGISST